MIPWLTGAEERIHEKEFVNGWELCGRGSIRKGKWKANFIPKPKGTDKWQLYDLSVDPGEIHDKADSDEVVESWDGERKSGKEILDVLLGHWEDYVRDVGVVPLQPELGTYVVEMEEQMPENAWMEYEYWKKGATVDPGREEFFREPKKFR